MNRYTVTVTRSGWVQSVHHDIRADSEADAIEIARLSHPYRAQLSFRAETQPTA